MAPGYSHTVTGSAAAAEAAAADGIGAQCMAPGYSRAVTGRATADIVAAAAAAAGSTLAFYLLERLRSFNLTLALLGKRDRMMYPSSRVMAGVVARYVLLGGRMMSALSWGVLLEGRLTSRVGMSAERWALLEG